MATTIDDFHVYKVPATSARKATVVFSHGFVEHSGRYTHVFERFAKRGIAVIAYDLRGFGRTVERMKSSGGAYGKTSTPEQLADLQLFVDSAKTLGVPVFVMGHSMGGALVLEYGLSRHPTGVSGIIASSPLITLYKPAPSLQRTIGGFAAKLLPNTQIPAPVEPKHISHDPVEVEKYAKDPLNGTHGTLLGISTMLSTGDKIAADGGKSWPKDLPVLVLHGTGDLVTSHNASENFIKTAAASDKTFVPFEGAYHEVHNEPDGVKEKFIDTIADWIEAYLPSSGAKL